MLRAALKILTYLSILTSTTTYSSYLTKESLISFRRSSPSSSAAAADIAAESSTRSHTLSLQQQLNNDEDGGEGNYERMPSIASQQHIMMNSAQHASPPIAYILPRLVNVNTVLQEQLKTYNNNNNNNNNNKSYKKNNNNKRTSQQTRLNNNNNKNININSNSKRDNINNNKLNYSKTNKLTNLIKTYNYKNKRNNMRSNIDNYNNGEQNSNNMKNETFDHYYDMPSLSEENGNYGIKSQSNIEQPYDSDDAKLVPELLASSSSSGVVIQNNNYNAKQTNANGENRTFSNDFPYNQLNTIEHEIEHERELQQLFGIEGAKKYQNYQLKQKEQQQVQMQTDEFLPQVEIIAPEQAVAAGADSAVVDANELKDQQKKRSGEINSPGEEMQDVSGAMANQIMPRTTRRQREYDVPLIRKYPR